MTTSKTFRCRVPAILIATAVTAPIGESASAGSATGPELTQVDSVNPGRYAGTWYQVAAVPQVFNLQCIDRTTAEYAVIDDATPSRFARCDAVIPVPRRHHGAGLGPGAIRRRPRRCPR